jgi:Putative zinc-finger
MKHPSVIQLALFAGGDLAGWERWRVRHHLSRCEECKNELEALRRASEQVREVAAELPKDLNWNRLAQEMTGNIRVGLAAGEAIARFDKPAVHQRPRLAWSAGTALACATMLFVFAFWASIPRSQAEHFMQSFKRIAAQGMGNAMQRPGALTQEDVVLEASSSGIQVKENGRTMSLTHPHSDSDSATVSVNMQGSAGVRFIDADSGQVTTNKVYYAEQ